MGQIVYHFMLILALVYYFINRQDGNLYYNGIPTVIILQCCNNNPNSRVKFSLSNRFWNLLLFIYEEVDD